MWTNFDYQNPPTPELDYWLRIEGYDETAEKLSPRLGQACIYDKEERGEGDGPGFEESNRHYPPPDEFERVTHYMLIVAPELPEGSEDSPRLVHFDAAKILDIIARREGDAFCFYDNDGGEWAKLPASLGSAEVDAILAEIHHIRSSAVTIGYRVGQKDGREEERDRLLAPFIEIGAALKGMME